MIYIWEIIKVCLQSFFKFLIRNPINLVTALAAIFTGIFIFMTWRTSRKTFVHQTLANLEKEYRSPEMGFSIDALWAKYHELHENTNLMVNNYMQEWNRNRLSGGTLDDLTNYWHLQRRRVSISLLKLLLPDFRDQERLSQVS